MKKHILTIFLPLTFMQFLHAATITVSNKSNSPGQYTNVQAAIDAAAIGDTILVTGSPTNYGDFSVSKKLFIYGQGYDPRKDLAFATSAGTIVFQPASNGSMLAGFNTTSINLNGVVQNLTIKRNRINSMTLNEGCVLTDNIVLVLGINGNNVVVANNFIQYLYSQTNAQGIIIINNHFSLGFYNICLSVSNALVANNIFYQKSNSMATLPYVTSTFNTTFNNNIYFNTSNANPLMLGVNNNTGNGNFTADPKYINFDFNDATINRNDNMQLQAGSPAINAGTDGKDIGPYGGASPMQYPLSGEPAIPQIRSMNISNTVIPVNGTINVKLKANAGN